MIGLTIDATFVAEVFGFATPARWLRICAIFYLLARLPNRGRSFLGDCLRASVIAIVTGMIVEALWPQYYVGALHIIFISGFGFIVMTVAIRVIFGHSGYSHLFQKPLPFFIITAILLFLAMVSRYIAELAAPARTIHLVAAALCWIVAAALWILKALPKIRQSG